MATDRRTRMMVVLAEIALVLVILGLLLLFWLPAIVGPNPNSTYWR